MIKNIRHTGIVTDNIEKSLYFFRDLMGFKISKRTVENGSYIDKISGLSKVNVITIKMTAPDGQMIELLYYNSHPQGRKSRQINDIGIAHISFTVKDVEKVYSLLLSQGVSFNAPPQVSPDRYAKVTFCRAPEGTFIELVQVLQR